MKNKFGNVFKVIILSIVFSFSSQSFYYEDAYAETIQSHINDVVSQQQINQSNIPKYADQANTSESIDPITGNLTLKQTDVTLTGKDGLDLTIGRVYHSSEDECEKRLI